MRNAFGTLLFLVFLTEEQNGAGEGRTKIILAFSERVCYNER